MKKGTPKIPFPAYRGNSGYVFISYAHADARLVYPELERLKRLGYNVWYDEGVSPGSRWSEELAKRIKHCSLFLVLVTPNVAKSIHCQDELNYVLEADRPVLAMHLTETELPPGLKLRLGARQAILSYKLSNDDIDRKLAEILSTQGVHNKNSEHVDNVATLDLSPGDDIGNFHLLEVLGEGGMGTVFLAEQREPVARRVALKVIKLGMDTKEVLARFEAERQALAVLSHPNIATVFEGGATSSGRPYFVMEHVSGVSITEYCDLHKLELKARVRLLLQACKGVLHAHQKGIIHRDLKSSNLLVCESSGSAQVKIIDFGIAKSMQCSLSEATLYTRIGDAVGSPGYASPEQLGGNLSDIDTRTDVYSLGVVLYELLSGKRPFDDETFLTRDITQIRQLLRDTEPPTPESKLPRDETLAITAKKRDTAPEKIRSEIKGDLSSIVMKAIRSRRDDRYPSVSALVADLDRYLTGAPVEASPHTALYLLSRFIKRHAVGVATGIAIFLLLVAATITSTYSFLLAKKEATRANIAATQAQTTVDFLVRLFEGSSPDNSPDPSLTARQLLDQGAERLLQDAELDAGVKLQLSETVADVYLRLWLPERAISLLRESIKSTVQELGANHIFVLRARIKLGDVLRANDELKEGKEILAAARAQIDNVDGVTIDDRARLANNLALVMVRLGETESAEPLYLEALALRRKEQGERRLSVAVTLHNLGLLYLSTGQLDLAEKYTRMSLDIRNELFDKHHPRVASSLSVLSSILRENGKYRESETLIRKTLKIREKVFGPKNGLVANTLYELGRVLVYTGDWQAAKDAYTRSLQIYPEDSVDWAFSAYRLSELALSTGQYEEAEKLVNAARKIILTKHSSEHHLIPWLNTIAARSLVAQNLRLNVAEENAREAVNLLTESHTSDHISVNMANIYLAQALLARGESKVALKMAEDSLNATRDDTSRTKPFLAKALETVAKMYFKSGSIEKGCSLLQEYISLRLSYYNSDHPYVTRAKLESCEYSELLTSNAS